MLSAYLVAIHGPFIFDDVVGLAIETVHQLWPPAWLSISRRPLTMASFALSWWMGGGQPWAFRAFNIGVHLAAAALVFLSARLVLRTPRFALPEPRATWVAGFTSLFWAVHPLHTSSVSYVIHRHESLAGMFYLGAIAAFLAGAVSDRPWRLYMLSIAACLLGSLSKEILVTAPLVLFLIDAILLSSGARQAMGRRWKVHVALWLSLVPMLLTLLWFPASGSQGVQEGGISRLQYLLSEPAVLAHYLRLVVLPTGLSIDYYDWPVVNGLQGWTLGAWLVAAGAVASVAGLVRRAPWALATSIALLILAPTSSIIPLNGELAAERRMYLPLAPLLLLCVAAAAGAAGRFRIPPAAQLGVALLAVTGLTALTSEQNARYLDATVLLKHGVQVRPNNPRARTWYAWSLLATGRIPEAAEQIKVARTLAPNFSKLDWMDSNIAVRLGRHQEAAQFVMEALKRAAPDEKDAVRAAWIFERAGLFPEALRLREQTVEHYPGFAPAHRALAWQLATDQRFRDPARALTHAERAVALLGAAVTPWEKDSLAAALAANGRFTEALALVSELAEGAPATGSAEDKARFRAQAAAFAAERPWSREDEEHVSNTSNTSALAPSE